jgi:sirohydrochlorin ferrochelatase
MSEAGFVKRKSRRKGYVIVAHGSREAHSNKMFLATVRRLTPLLSRGADKALIIGCFLEMARPTIPEALEQAVKQGARDIVVTPLLLFPGRHALEDIPAIVRETARRHRGNGIRFTVKKALAYHPEFLTFLKETLA